MENNFLHKTIMLIISDNVEQNLFLQWHKKTGTDYVATQERKTGTIMWLQQERKTGTDSVAKIEEEDWNRFCGYNGKVKHKQILCQQQDRKTETDSVATMAEEDWNRFCDCNCRGRLEQIL